MRKRVLVLLRYRVLGGMNLVTGQPTLDRSRKGKPDRIFASYHELRYVLFIRGIMGSPFYRAWLNGKHRTIRHVAPVCCQRGPGIATRRGTSPSC